MNYSHIAKFSKLKLNTETLFLITISQIDY